MTNSIVEIDTDIIPLKELILRPSSIRDSFHCYGSIHYQLIEAIRSNDISKIGPKHCEGLISENKYTILHILSVLGKSEQLTQILNNSNESILIMADQFGKSPLFYSKLRKEMDCFDILLEYLINFDETDKNKLVKSLYSTRNDFMLIIETSSANLTTFLSKIVITSESKLPIPISFKLPNILRSSTMMPSFKIDFFNTISSDENTRLTNSQLKYIAISLPIQPYSTKNISALQVLSNCSDKKLYDDIVIQFFINYNWNQVFRWAVCYSVLIWIHLIFYGITLIDTSDIYLMIPFWITYCLIFIWEILQMRVNFREYRSNAWNFIDILLILSTPVWSILRILNVDSLYIDLALALLLMIRGIPSFKIFDGTRHYIRLILQSLNNIKYFLIIFIYSTLFFSLLLFIVLSNDEEDKSNYFEVLKKSWALSVGGDMGIESQYNIIFLVIFISTILNLILMLNMLISILGDSYDQFTIDKNMIDYRERISLTLEVQTALFWKNQVNQSFFVHFLESQFQNRMQENDDWQGRIMYAEQRQEMRIDELAKKVDGVQIKIDGVQSKIDRKIDGVKSEINKKIDGVEMKITEMSSQLVQLIESLKSNR
jgi:peptidoglycan hydrolase CwlO-like protein